MSLFKRKQRKTFSVEEAKWTEYEAKEKVLIDRKLDMYRREEEWKIQNDLLVTKRGIIDEIDFARKERNQVNMELARLKAARDKYVADNAMQQALIENKGNEITRLKSIIDGLIASIPKQFIIQGK